MASVILFDAARMQAIEDGTVVSGLVDGFGHLILTHHDASTVDAGKVTADNLADADTTTKGIVELATSAETETGTDTVRAVTPKGLADTFVDKQTAAGFKSTTTQRGVVQLATSAEAIAGTDTDKAITSKALLDTLTPAIAKIVKNELPLRWDFDGSIEAYQWILGTTAAFVTSDSHAGVGSLKVGITANAYANVAIPVAPGDTIVYDYWVKTDGTFTADVNTKFRIGTANAGVGTNVKSEPIVASAAWSHVVGTYQVGAGVNTIYLQFGRTTAGSYLIDSLEIKRQTQVMCRLTKNIAQNGTTSSVTVKWNNTSADIDTAGFFPVTGSFDTIIVPKTGWYRTVVALVTSGTPTRTASIRQNGVGVAPGANTGASGAASDIVIIDELRLWTAGDTCDCIVIDVAAGSSVSATSSYIAMTLVMEATG